MNKKIKNLFTLTVASFVFVLAACNMSFSMNKKNNQEEQLVQIHPVVQTQSRSALPDYDYVNITKTDLTDLVFSYKDKSSNVRTMNFDTVEELEAAEIHVLEGTYTFTLRAKFNGLTLSGQVTKTVTLDDENTIAFVLQPSASTSVTDSDAYGTVIITLYFPEGTVPAFNDGKIKLNGTDIAIAEKDYSFNSEVCAFVFKKNLKPSDKAYDIELSLIDQNNDVFTYYTSALIEKDKISTENYSVEKFHKGYKITWHINDVLSDPEDEESEIDHSNDVVTYYATAYGYDLYLPKNYNWFTDADCTQAASVGLAGKVKGEKEFWATVNSSYSFVNIYDIDNPEVPIKKLTIPTGNYYYIDTDYTVRTTSSNSSEIEKFNLDCKEGYYVSYLYKNSDRSNSFSSYGTSYSSTYYPNIYVEYKPCTTLTLISVGDNAGEVLGTHEVKGSYYLSDYYISFNTGHFGSYNVQTWNFVSKSLNYYSDEAKTSTLYKSSTYYPTENVTIYVDDYLEPIYTVNLININNPEDVRQFQTKYYFSMSNYDYTVSTSESSGKTTSLNNEYIKSFSVKDSNENNISLELGSTKYYLDSKIHADIKPEIATAIDQNNELNIYVDIVPLKTVTYSYKYNTPYKLKIVDTERNSQFVIKKDNTYMNSYEYYDADKEYIWYIYTTTNSGNSSVTLYYIPIDCTSDFTCRAGLEEVAPLNSEELTIETTNYYGEYDKYELLDSDTPFVVYTYNLEAGNYYYVNYTKHPSVLSDGTPFKWYLVSPSGKCEYNSFLDSDYEGSGSCKVAETGTYKLIFKPYRNSTTSIKIKYQFCEVRRSESDITLSVVTSDLGSDSQKITVTKADTTMTLTAPDGYDVYEWKVGSKLLGTEKVITVNLSNFAGLAEGTETYFVTLRTKTLDSAKSFWYSTQFELAATPQEAE